MTTDRTPIPLEPVLIEYGSSEFEMISTWNFIDPFVTRLLATELPQRMMFGLCKVYIYSDPSGQPVGFGSMDLCRDYAEYTAGQLHPYLPLLALKPNIKSLGYGTTILRHLTDLATSEIVNNKLNHGLLFLDVYTTNHKAVALYRTEGFSEVSSGPIVDELEGGNTYIIMAKRVSVEFA